MANNDQINVFFSYAHIDDDFYNFIDRFKDSLSYLVAANSNNSLKVFIDRDDIEWGDNWKNRIALALVDAPILLPMISANYLKSENCREEFFAFYSKAQELGVTELILPVIISDSLILQETNGDDELFKLCADLQWIDFSEAILYSSHDVAWKKKMMEIALRFIRTYQSAESKVISESERTVDHLKFSHENVEEERDGILDLNVKLQEDLEGLTQELSEIPTFFQQLTEASKAFKKNTTSNPRQIQVEAIKLARCFDSPAKELGNIGDRIFQQTTQIDKTIRLLRETVDQAPSELGLPKLDKIFDEVETFETAKAQLEGMLESMQTAELMSAAVRRSLRPVRTGVTKINDSIDLMLDWHNEVDDLN